MSLYRPRLLPESTRNAIAGILIGVALALLFVWHVELTGQRIDRAQTAPLAIAAH